jgi:DNA-binding transcriptional MerR regulator
MAPALKIGQLAQTTGVSAKTIRYYEQVGVLPAPSRNAAGYRQYSPHAVHRLLFIRRARTLGLPLRDLKALTAALDHGPRGTVRPRLLALVRAQLSAVEQQATEMQILRRQLEQVLGRLLNPRSANHTEGCRCLEIEDGAARSGRRPGMTMEGSGG